MGAPHARQNTPRLSWLWVLAVAAAAFTAGRLLPLQLPAGPDHPGSLFGAGHPAAQQQTPIRVFVGVLSASDNRERREAVRQTWGADPRLERVVFAVARPWDEAALSTLQDEALTHGDIVFTGHVHESYYNVTHQTLDIFKAAHAYGAGRPVTHVLKTDDDSFIHVGNLLALLQAQPMQETAIGAVVTFRPLRMPNQVFTISEEEWPTGSPTHELPLGAGYILTKDLVDYVATGTAVHAMPGIVHKFEDSAVGLCLQLLQNRGVNVTLVNAPESYFLGRNCSPDFVVGHTVTAQEMRCLHRTGVECCAAAAQSPWSRWRLNEVCCEF